MYSRWDFKQILQQGYVDIIQPDVSMAGGISEVRRIAAMAEGFDVAVALHCPLGPIAFMASLQLDSTLPNAFIQEQVLDVHDVGSSASLATIAEPTVFAFDQGTVYVPSGPGLGLMIDEVQVREAAAEGHRWRPPLWRADDGSIVEW
jgi:galactonate dehydratase